MNTSAVKRRTIGDIIFFTLNYAIFFVITIISIYPFYYVLINTVSANNLSAGGQIVFLPRGIHFRNYTEVLRLPGLSNAAMISVLRTSIGTVCTVSVSAFLGFLFSQQKMFMRKFLYRMIIITMYFQAGIIPWYIIMMHLGLTNNFWAYILPAIVQPFNIILVKTYIESTPYSLQEAAKIDGANPLQVFFMVMLPILKPILATIAIFAAVGQWNSFMDTLILVTDQRLHTLQYMLFVYISQANSLAQALRNSSNIESELAASLATRQTPTSIRMTVTVVVVLPILAVYPYFQKHFVKGIMVGAIKG